MTERLTSVSAALELLVPPFEDDGGDWAEILKRAGQALPAPAPPRRPRSLRPRILLAAAVLLALLASAPAWSGAGYGRIVHFLTGKPSKKVVENLQHFDEGAPPGQAVRPIVGKTRKVYERRTRFGVYRIWLTPTKTGRVCETLEGPGSRGTQPYSGGCGPKTPVRGIEVGGTGGGSDFFRGELDGRVRPGITSLELRYVNGAHENVPVQNGYFVAVIPAVRMGRISDHPAELVGRDRRGNVVASQPLRSFYIGFPAGMGRPPIARTKHERRLLHARLAAKTTVTLDVSPARGGGTCARLAVARATWTWTCAVPPIRHPLRIDLLRVPTASGTRLLLYGIVRPGVTLRFGYEDGTTQRIPIADDYFLATIPKPRWQPGHRLAEIVAEADGRDVLRVPVARKGGAFYTGPPDRRPEFGRIVRPKPPRPAGPLHGTVQRAEADGVSVEASRKGAVNFRVAPSAPAWSLLKRTNVSYACFHVRRAHAPWDVDEMGVWAGLARSGQVSIWVERPLDGCEIQGGYGHRWRDRHGTHSAVEIPFDARGRRFFTERATARDLANLVRSRAMHAFRKRGPAAPANVIVGRFGGAVVPLRTPGERPPVGKVGYWSRGNRVVVSEIAPTGTRFFIVLVDGHVSQSNVDGLTRAL